MMPGDFIHYYYQMKYDSTCKGSEQTELYISHMYDCTVTAELYAGLGYKASCGHVLGTWQLTQRAPCPSFAKKTLARVNLI